MTAPVFATPEDAEAAFYRAFENTDLDAMMDVWSPDDPGIVCIHPGGARLRGPDAIREAWKQIFEGGMPLTFRLTDYSIVGRPGMRIHNVREEIRLRGKDAIAAVVLATNVFIERPGIGWRLWMHHGSNPVAGPDTAGDDDDSRPTLH
jgi:ketosteroid isomerase-like protein